MPNLHNRHLYRGFWCIHEVIPALLSCIWARNSPMERLCCESLHEVQACCFTQDV
jgi:hypothetical protein